MYQSYPKSGQMTGRKKFSGEEAKSGWDDAQNEKRDFMKSGVSSVVTKGGSSEKFKQSKESAGNTSRREYPKKGHSATKFGTTVSQGS